ncbi:MAG TPA: BadF/BadG/BcrA/BcrD ATPase family protein [Candidatus Limnocylindrales bacterium]|nr:BadF/BadG/BcrA/BcrD ATPase family protein [Candidatus Limnocylindrales bacterium]
MATAPRVLAIDGGQSAVRARHSESTAAVSVDGVSRAPATDRRIAVAVLAAWQALGSPDADRIVLGLTTAPGDAADALRLAADVATAIGSPEVWLCDDSVTSHAGALSLGAGVSLVAGTGVACLVVPDVGRPQVVGGHGYLLGDEGGGFWIGREGLRAALRAREGRGPQTALTSLAEARFGDLAAVPARLHDDDRAVNAIAHFATDILDAAATDALAAAIVDAAATELHGVLAAAVRLAGDGGSVAVALGGRLLVEPTPLRAALDERLAGEPTLLPRTADASPLDGAMLLGRQADPGRYAPLVHVWRGPDS